MALNGGLVRELQLGFENGMAGQVSSGGRTVREGYCIGRLGGSSVARILLVEDEHLLRRSLGMLLEREGHRVTAAANLAEAAAGIGRQPELLHLALTLPDGNGLDFLEENLDRFRETVVLVTTGSAGEKEIRRAMCLGVEKVLAKPVAHRDLLKIIARLLGS